MAVLALALAMPLAAHPQFYRAALPARHVPPMPYPAASAHPGHEEQNAARREVRAGNVRRLQDIERRVLPTMPGMQYLGPEYDAEAMAYRLKFIRDGRVVFVDVDARTGLVLGRTR
jgi:hypothetical protein